MHGTTEYENCNGYFNIISAVTLVPHSGAICNADVLATVGISRSPCSDFMNMNIGACASDQNRSSMEKELILLLHINEVIFLQVSYSCFRR